MRCEREKNQIIESLKKQITQKPQKDLRENRRGKILMKQNKIQGKEDLQGGINLANTELKYEGEDEVLEQNNNHSDKNKIKHIIR